MPLLTPVPDEEYLAPGTDLFIKVEQPTGERVLVPYVAPSERLQVVLDAIRIQGVRPVPVLMSSEGSYWELLSSEWAKGREFFVVEHDVLVWFGAIAQMRDCSADWCSLPMFCRGKLVDHSFGVVKFSARLIALNPGVWRGIDHRWQGLDNGFNEAMYLRYWAGDGPHAHTPPATHLNEVHWPNHVSRRLAHRKTWTVIGGE